MTTEKKLYKDWFDREAARLLGAQIQAVHPDFDAKAFVRHATAKLSELEFHARVRQFSDALHRGLPTEVPGALEILTRSLPPVLPDAEQITDGWLQWPLGQWIAEHASEYPDEAFPAMRELTRRFTSEFAVRPFVERYPEKTFAYLLSLTGDPCPHVRRWCSEGVRPRLPWGKRLRALVEDPVPVWPLLEALKDDPELYVRRSVANCLNDIGKDHPELLLERCRAWSENATPERSWVIRHALRTRVKDGDPGALSLLGFSDTSKLSARFQADPKLVKVGEAIELSARVVNNSTVPAKVMLDFVVHYVRQKDKTGEKVFKWKQFELAPGESVELRKKLSFRITSARALYTGSHRIQLQANGKRIAEISVKLENADGL